MEADKTLPTVEWMVENCKAGQELL